MSTLVIAHAAQLATPLGKTARCGAEMRALRVIEDAAVVAQNGVITAVGPSAQILAQTDLRDAEILDASGKCVVPGFVDSHTHFLFGGYREEEFLMRLAGKGYLEILAAGGGILDTVRHTRSLDEDGMLALGKKRLDDMLSYGVTTVEGKSGYGLDRETELRTLRALKHLNQTHSVDVISTFLGAHAVPEEYAGRGMAYIDFILQNVLPSIREEQLADFCDVFCEQGVFSVEESEKLLQKAKEMGFACKIHADEMEPFGGAELAARVGCVSADHLLRASEKGISAMAEAGVVATVLPATAFCMQKPFADARAMIDAGGAVAMASDYNPGSCFCNSIPLLFALACINMHLSVEEALTSMTLNGAAALCRADSVGSIEPGKKADLVVLADPSYRFLVYRTAGNLVERVYKNGRLAFQKGMQPVETASSSALLKGDPS
ncbi:MAG: imidazolonepropionase [Ethanoligenens sp.]